jgi:hypothetical protein
MANGPTLIERHARARVEEALADTPVVVLQGARQVGKSTLARMVAGERGVFVTLDDEPVRRAVLADPAGFVAQYEGLLVIDEVQRAPEVLLAIKAEVDRRRQPGMFLLTGSANLLRLRSVQDSLAGRAETIELLGFSQGELAGVREQFLDQLWSGEVPVSWTSKLGRPEYLQRACAGSYPEAHVRSERRRSAWFSSYAQRIVERDAHEISAGGRLGDLPRLLRLVAARNATELNQADLASDAAFPARTLAPYLDLLETLYLVWRVPAWSTNLTSRVTGRAKLVVLDSGLAAHLAHLTPASMALTANPEPAGPLLEGMVLAELRRQSGWSEGPVHLSHYRDRAGPEVDVIIEHPDGRIAAVEVKATSSLGPKAFRPLQLLRDRLGDRFAQGVVLYTGGQALRFGERLSAQPIEALWRESPRLGAGRSDSPKRP